MKTYFDVESKTVQLSGIIICLLLKMSSFVEHENRQKEINKTHAILHPIWQK